MMREEKLPMSWVSQCLSKRRGSGDGMQAHCGMLGYFTAILPIAN